jgi:hypothetical protein
MAFLRSNPPQIDFVTGHTSGTPVRLRIQTVGTIGFGPHPSWVSYLVQTPSGGWVHTTLWKLPADSKIDVEIDQYDSGSALRNQQVGLVTGVQDATLDGQPLSLINSNTVGVGHTFSIPTLGINVPLAGVSSSATNTCSSAPCSTGEAHRVIRFSFTTPGPGDYPWQCFVPCGLGYLYGNGGPMQTIGYMDGFLEVRPT